MIALTSLTAIAAFGCVALGFTLGLFVGVLEARTDRRDQARHLDRYENDLDTYDQLVADLATTKARSPERTAAVAALVEYREASRVAGLSDEPTEAEVAWAIR